jgi:hypothetical protein
MDIYNINTMDKLKANEIGNRYLTTGDIKNQEFQLLQTEIVLEALQAIQEDRQLDPKNLLKKYDFYFKKWNSPYK